MSFSDAHRSHENRVSTVFLVLLAVFLASGAALWMRWGNYRVGVFIFVAAGWLVSLCLHEFAHAKTAQHGGDLSVGAKGYLTLNPLKYTHPVYSFVMPLIFVILGGIALPGGAVYIERGRIRSRAKNSLISLAGPAVNAAVAVVLLLWLANVGLNTTHPAFYAGVGYLALLQLMAAILNLLPVPGLDGYGIIEPYLSYANRRALANFAPYGMMIVFLLLWNPSINAWFFDNIIYRIMNWFGYQTLIFAQVGMDAFPHPHLGGLLG